MHQRRPRYIEDIIDRNDKNAREFPLPPLSYTFEGEDDDYRLLGPNGRHISTTELLDSEAPLRILDIGAAQGAFVLRAQQIGHIAHALTLHDYRGMRESMIADRINQGSYIIGNAERIDEIDGLLDEYDLIVSSMTFRWMTDPMGALEQAADKVAPGGKLIVSHLPVGESPRVDDLRVDSLITDAHVHTELARAGFDHSSIVEVGRMRHIYGERGYNLGHTAARVAFALGYEQSSNQSGWRYTAIAPVIEPAVF